MRKPHTLRGLLSILLTAALVFSFPPVPARAEELREPEIGTVADCITGAPGLEMSLEGTVTYADTELVVLQDDTGGIPLILPQDVTVSEELVLRITGCRSAAGFVVMDWEVRGRAPLPEAEAALGDIPEHRRVVLRDVTVAQGYLWQDGLSLPLAAGQPQDVSDGSRADVWGIRHQELFYARQVTVLEAGDQPPEDTPAETEPSGDLAELTVTATPADGILLEGELVALHCNVAGAALYYTYSYDGDFYSQEQLYSGGIPADREKSGIYIRAWAVTPEGTESIRSDFYFTWEPEGPDPTEPEETAPEWKIWFGQLHAHSGISTGTGTPDEVFRKAKDAGLDFFAITDYSENFDNSAAGSLVQAAESADWQAGRSAAAEVTGNGFVALYGFEMTWPDRPKRGHISTFGTNGWQSQLQPEFSELTAYYEALLTDPDSVSQFNHPGETGYGGYGDFQDYGHYSARYDSVIHLMEVGGEDKTIDYEPEYNRALDAGWHLAPTNGDGSHDVLGSGIGNARTAVLAKDLSEKSIMEAIRAHRVYATEDEDLQVVFYADGAVMGSVLDQEPAQLTVSFRDLHGDPMKTVEVVTKGGNVAARQTVSSGEGELAFALPGGYPYYYLRLTQADGDVAITAPIWVDTTVDAGIRSFTMEQAEPRQGQQVQLSVELYNDEAADFQVDSLEFTLGGQVIHRAENVQTVKALGSQPYSFSFLYDGLGAVEIQAKVTGTVGGKACTDTESCTMVYQADPAQITLGTIASARKGITGQVYRVKGYVTAGTLNASNTFPGKIYLQDDTAGIAVTGFTDSGIQTGAPLEVTGTLALSEGEPVLQLLTYTLLSEDYYNYTPSTSSISDATDLEKNGGMLVQVEGMVMSLVRTTDGLGVSRFTLRDTAGAVATVRIDPGIGSGTYGTNQLTHQVGAGRWVRVKGILIREADGTAVILVCNCDEVVAVTASSLSNAAQADPTNPKTGQRKPFRAPFGTGIPTTVLLAVMAITAMGLGALYGMKRRR